MTIKHTHRRWPYEELQIEADIKPNTFNFATPWAYVRVEFEPSFKERVAAIAQLITSGPNIDAIDEVTWLMSQLDRFPFFYCLPKYPITAGLPQALQNQSAERQTPYQFIATYLSRDIVQPISITNTEWEWDIDGALAFSHSTKVGFYDPSSILTVCRRFHYLTMQEKDVYQGMYQTVSELKPNKDQFKFACAFILRQSHAITERCIEVLEPALTSSGDALEAVKQFIHSEKGHDKILRRAIEATGFVPEQLPIIDTLSVLMQLFKIAAERNFLAFAIIVDFFVGQSFEPGCFFADFLEENGFGGAAKQLYRHKAINNTEHHENVSMTFLQNLEAFPEHQVIEAICFAELISRFIANLSKDLLNHLTQLDNASACIL